MSNPLQEKELIDFIKKFLLKKGNVVEITSETLLFKERMLNSMNILDLIGYIEKKIGRRLKDEEIIMTNFQSVRVMASVFFHE